jgi:MbtH protein
VTTEPIASTAPYRVVVNGEQQYSIWFADRQLPPGWTFEGRRGTREDCLAYIAEVWTDIRPLSVRQASGVDTESAPPVGENGE